ncbi:response regulator [Caldalkalibacillus mannanilyticus]|uniref:response regulator n=1 Tax=Caldalkalibacillus mannanilyticus TaxID=1418 RepID=UPI00046846ED|nr:response regulator transcription factor [Caldalkalibacillus mannanilyticus]
MDVINVVIVDDHKAICSGLSSYLRNTEGVNVIAELHSGKELFSYLTKNSPNVIVMDIKLLGDEKSENGLLITKSLRNQGILIPIIIYSGYDYLYEK